VQNDEAERAGRPGNRGAGRAPSGARRRSCRHLRVRLPGGARCDCGAPRSLMVLAFATALGGGVIRDVLMGDLPPKCTARLELPLHRLSRRRTGLCARTPLTGAARAARDARCRRTCAVCGGRYREGARRAHPSLLTQVPAILRVDVYATAALLGALVLVTARRLGISRLPAALLGVPACFALRMLAVWQHWQLPTSLAAA